MRYPETAALIRSARRKKGLSQEKAAIRVGCTRLQWINWEKGAHRPTRYVQELVDVIGVDGEKLAAADEDEESSLSQVSPEDLLAALFAPIIDRRVDEKLARHKRECAGLVFVA